ncbi:hypothetical protein BG011_009966 [Mortierella polycephala]|uniref:RZ-type domain-containing protein n=1 Tax=Mortierella polycephala TaxID=41804 RepID=A0A9P6TVU1_9FUNG|nr:hypothetical protein BG011_009966 [Mortierella polycephala]
MALSCGHAATMSTLDGMMEMNTYYQEQVDKKTGDVTYISKKDLPGKEVPQVSCHLCRQPIVTLLRYGRRIKYGQLSMRMKKHQVAQAKAMRDAQEEFDVNRILVQDGQAKFLQSLSISEMESCRDPPAEKTRRLGRYKDSSQKFPGVNFLLITTVYNIPREHEKAWAEFLGPLSKSLKKVTAIYNVAMRSPTKQLFDAAVSHLYRLKTAPTMGLPGATEEPVMADDVIRACILECGLPSDGHGGSSYVDSLQEKTNILLFVLAQAFVALDDTGISSGWYWFVEDLIQCCYVHTCILIEAAKNGKYPRKETHARLHRLDLIVKRVRWIGQRAVPEDDAAMEARLDRVNEDNEFFLKEIGEIVRNCPLGISEMCAERVTALQDTMQDVVKVARSATFYQSVSRAEKFEVFRVMSDQLGGSGHWYQCPNGHTYVIADCGMAMTQSECPECGESIGGGHHALLRSNRLDQEFEEMYRQRR